jgi:hypothetical protein
MLCYAMLCRSRLCNNFLAQSLHNASIRLSYLHFHASTALHCRCSPLPVSRVITLLREIPRRLLARLQLLQIVPTSRHIASRLVKALRELRCIRRARSAGSLLAVDARLAVVEACIHGLGIRIGRVLLVGLVVVGLCWGGSFWRRGRTAAEESTDCVADGGADCYATWDLLVFRLGEGWMHEVERTQLLMPSGQTSPGIAGLLGRLAPEHGLEVVQLWSCHAVAVAEVREMGVQVRMGEMELGRRHRCVLLLNVAL